MYLSLGSSLEFFLRLVRSVMIIVYVTDTPSAFVMLDSDILSRLPAANS